MFSLGVDLHDGRGNQPAISTDIALRSHQQVLEAFKFMGIEHTIALMHRLGTEPVSYTPLDVYQRQY